MKLLLTSEGLTNESIKDALEDLVGKPRKEIKIAFVPTPSFVSSDEIYKSREWLAEDMYRIKEFCGYFMAVSLADASIAEIMSNFTNADVIFVGGGNDFYLSYMLEKLGLFEELPKLLKTRVYAGISAGSIITTPGLELTSQAIAAREKGSLNMSELGPKGRSLCKTLNFVPFYFRPHYGDPERKHINAELLRSLRLQFGRPIYALDDESALKIDGEKIEVISEGNWELFE